MQQATVIGKNGTNAQYRVIRGIESDKPVANPVYKNTIFARTDVPRLYICDGREWKLVASLQAIDIQIDDTLSAGIENVQELYAYVVGLPSGNTNLGIANITATTLDITSSTGTDATVPASTTTDAGLMTAAQFNNLADAFLKSVDTTDDITEGAVNKWNVTHTSEVTGATALTLNKTAISNRTAATIVGSDYLLFGDTSDSDNLKKGLVSDIITAATPSGAALTRVDDTNVTITLGGTPSTALLQAASLTLGWSGQLAISRGGTGAATAATARVNILPSLSGNTLKVLRVNAGETDVEWATSSSGGITINTTTITGGVSNRLLYNNAGTVGEITVGSSGTFLRSNGTSWEASTPTLSVTPTSGTYIRGDGTNWITSTLKLPNTATANYIPYATGANTWGESGNLKFDTISLSVLTSGAEATPTITIGSVGNGIYLPTANTLGFATNGQQRFQIDGTSLNSITIGGGYIRRASGAASTPTFAFNGTTNTGMWLNGTSLAWSTAGVHVATLDTSGRMYIGGSTSPTATLHLKAGSTSASSSPIKLTSGSLMTAAEVGAIEYLTDDVYFTISTGTARKRVSLVDPSGGLTSGRVACITTNGRLTDYVNMTFNGTTFVTGNIYGNTIGCGVQFVGGTGTSVSSRLYRTTNGGSDIRPYIHLGNAVFSAGEMVFTYLPSEGIGIAAHNGTRYIMRAALQCINLTNTAGSEAGDLALYTQSGGTAISQKMRISGLGNIVIGNEAALATNATNGFLYIPTCAGTPTGVPTAYTGKVALVFDTTNSKLYVYNGGWIGGTTPGVFV